MLNSLLALALLIGQQNPVELGKQLLQAQEWDKALTAFEQAIELNPENGEAHYYAAQLYAYRRDDKNTIGHFREALRLLPDQQIIWSEYGKWLLNQLYLDEAERVFRKLIEMAPRDAGYWRNLGLSLYQNSELEEAREAYARSIELDPQSAQTFYLAGVAARSLNAWSQAKDLINRGLALEPGHSELNLQMAELLLQDGELEQALKHLQTLDESHLAGNYFRGAIYLKLGELPTAERFLLRVIEADPSHTQAHYQLGRLYARMRKKELSEQFFSRFRALEEQDRERKRISERKTIVDNEPDSN